MAIRARSIIRPRGGVMVASMPAVLALGSGTASNPAFTGSLLAIAPQLEALGVGNTSTGTPYTLPPITHVASPTQTGVGHSGSEGDPFSPADAFAFDPGSIGAHIRLLAGNWDTTQANPSNSKYAYFNPLHSGTASAPLIYSGAENPNAPGADDYPRFRRTAGAGGILGVVSKSYVEFHRFTIPTFIGSHDGNENYQFSCWGAGNTGIKITRAIFDGEGLGESSQDSTNSGAIWAQPSTGLEVGDVTIRRIGSNLRLGPDIWSGLEFYDSQDLYLHNITIEEVHGFGVFLKGDPTREFLRCRMRDILVRDCTASAYFAYQIEAEGADINTWANLIAIDCAHGFQINRADNEDDPGPHRGTVLQNFVFARCAEGFMIRGAAELSGGGNAYAPPIRFSNGVFYQCGTNVSVPDNVWTGNGVNSVEADYNRYISQTLAHFSDNNGFRTFSGANSWQTLLGNGTPQDQHGDTGAHTFVDASADDFRTADSVAADAIDTLGIYGAPGAAVRRGARGEIGCRSYV